ncbi:hypothetical protein ACC806_34510 [Rhizobium ruizarguesonis]
MTDPWEKWRLALADPSKIGKGPLAIHDGLPWTGFFRVRRKGAAWEPVQFWQDETGVWCAARSGHAVAPEAIPDLWLWACKNPITEEAFDRAVAGNGWADQPEQVSAGIGHNSGEADPFDELMAEFVGEKALVENALRAPIATKDQADTEATLLKRLRSIGNRADKLHAVEKAPHIVAGKKVDARWRELREAPDGYGEILKRRATAWLREQDRLERERAAKAAIEAERKRKEAEEEARKANSPEAQREAGAKVADAKEAERDAAYQRPQAGPTGEKMSLRTYRSGLITEFETFLAEVKDEEEIKEAAQRVANRLARQQKAVAGMEIIEEQRAV